MNDYLKKGFLLGIGIAAASKEKVETYVNDLVATGEVAPQEAKELIKALIEKGEQKEQAWSDETKAKVRETLKEFGLVTKDEFEAFEERLKAVEKSIYDGKKQVADIEKRLYEQSIHGVDNSDL